MMNRYRQFDNEIDLNVRNSAAILPETEIDDPFPIEFNPTQYSSRPSNISKLRSYCQRRTPCERYLICSLIFLIISLFVFTSFYRTYTKETICLTQSCIELAYSIYSSLNQSVDPCEDFHQFSCGNWMYQHTIPKGHFTWSIIKELTQKNMILLKNILEQTSISTLLDSEQQSIKYFQSCMNTSEIERLNIEPLKDFLAVNLNFTLSQWIHLDKSQTYQQLFLDLLTSFSKQYGFISIFPIRVDSDEKNSTWNNLHIEQPELILQSRDYYIDSTTNYQSNERNRLIRETFNKVGSDVLQLLGFEKNDSIQRISDVIQFETDLAFVSLPMEILQKPNETYYLMSLKQLQQLYQSIGLNVTSFFNTVFNINSSSSTNLNDDDKVIVLSYDLMSNVSAILTKYLVTSNKSHIVIDHMLLSFIFGKLLHLPTRFENALLPLRKALFGVDSISERWEYCLKQTDSAFGYAIGALFIKSSFDEADRVEANELLENIRINFEENLNQLSWIDEQTRVEAKMKLKNIRKKIGYPDFIKDPIKLNQWYAGFSMIEYGYFNNEMKVGVNEHRRAILKFRQKTDPTLWRMTPRTVNAYYSPPSNEIVFPAGILQLPLFHKDLPLAINYGAIGSVIGHEFTHGYDNQGGGFDADGNMRSWWSNFSSIHFEEKTKCFINQYSSFKIEGENVNGLRTLGENIADNGGVKFSYYAYRKHKQHLLKTHRNYPLPGLTYTNDQLFFIAFAHIWCNKQTSSSTHHDLISDPHSPTRFRIIGTVQNSEEFSEAFGCKSKALMNPSNKCQLW